VYSILNDFRINLFGEFFICKGNIPRWVRGYNFRPHLQKLSKIKYQSIFLIFNGVGIVLRAFVGKGGNFELGMFSNVEYFVRAIFQGRGKIF